MGVQVSYPGVYIDEFTPAAPIQGVGTSNAAFLGPAAMGPLNTPVKITSWDQFQAMFGTRPPENAYLWYAVRGFFQNGGTSCFITRVSNAAYDSLDLNDKGGKPTINICAKETGEDSGIKVIVTHNVHQTEATVLYS